MIVLDKYPTILADPPWSFKGYAKDKLLPQRTSNQHYNVLKVSELGILPIPDFAAKDCALFMWIVDSHVETGITLAKHWGFEFKTVAFIWDKGRIGMGYWTRKQAEICYLFTKGKPARRSKSVRQIIHAPRREHSRKPDEIYSRIEALVDGPYLECFARQTYPGWDSWGIETHKFQPEIKLPCPQPSHP